MRNSLITTAMLAVISSVASLETHAATLNNGDVLTITAGQVVYDANGYATCSVPCHSIEQRVWRLSTARDAMKQPYQQLGP